MCACELALICLYLHARQLSEIFARARPGVSGVLVLCLCQYAAGAAAAAADNPISHLTCTSCAGCGA